MAFFIVVEHGFQCGANFWWVGLVYSNLPHSILLIDVLFLRSKFRI